MPEQLVLMTDQPLDRDLVREILEEFHPDGFGVDSPRDGVLYMCDADQQWLVTIGTSRPVETTGNAMAMLNTPRPHARHWTELLIPYGEALASRYLVREITARHHGTLSTRR